ncbi:MAG: 6-hydroxycyclohex-1-ene-1-carbonyl-CoA dehydrogenase [Myxococcales bacterium]|nr:6-hydroxycyclohex-1-ene-1-carbonyl-CoA dehydrogenase [Myxococcales bacterium]
MDDTIRRGWRMTGPGQLAWFEEPLPEPPPGHVTVEVLGCGVCHTDLGYLYDGVAPAHKGPLVLGHEIIGRRADGGLVLVPAVSPCGECPACRRGRPTACAHGRMPGNHHDGGFATHVQVPSRYLCPVPAVDEPWRLAAIADAVTTPLQAVTRTGLAAGDVAIVVGAGGVGGFLVEIAVALGATVVAIDVAPARLERATAHGARVVVDPRTVEPKAARKELAKRLGAGAPDAGWHVFECSGTPAGQQLAFALLTRGGKLAIVGFTPEVIPLRLSNLMALDAEAYGNWGADPALYAPALELALTGKIDLASAVGRHALADAPAVLAAVRDHQVDHRPVLIP